MKKEIRVVAGVFYDIQSHPSKILLFRRNQDQSGAGYWEFPGGKIESGESLEQALVRELLEELSTHVKVEAKIGLSQWENESKVIHLTAFLVSTEDCQKPKDFIMSDHDDFAWFAETELLNLSIAPADIPLIPIAFKKLNSRQNE